MANKPRAQAGGNARNSAPLEKHVIVTILKYLNGLSRCYADKTHGSSYKKGQPDILGCLDGRTLAIEVKRPPESGRATEQTLEGWKRAGATELQINRLTKWQAAGAIAGVATSVEETKALLGLKD